MDGQKIVAVGVSGIKQVIAFRRLLIALLLLGIGWNFMFITATRLVSETYRLAEKGKTQASNEFLVFSMVTLSALASGWLESSVGWQRLNILVVPLLVLTLLVITNQRLHLRTIKSTLK